MKRLALILSLGLVAASPVWAAAAKPKIDVKACQALINHTPRADVTYQPGVDVNGKPVALADLPSDSGQIKMPSKFEIPLTVNLAKAINLDTSTYPYNQLGAGTEAVIGTITVEGNKTYFNGKPLDSAQQDNLAVLCMHPD